MTPYNSGALMRRMGLGQKTLLKSPYPANACFLERAGTLKVSSRFQVRLLAFSLYPPPENHVSMS